MNFTIDLNFLDAIASSDPTPGGGSAAAYAGAMAAALVMMVAQTTIGKKKYADVQTRILEIVAEATVYRAELEACVSRDAAAFESLLVAYRASKETSNPEQVEQAKLHVTEVPLGTAQTALAIVELAVELAATANLNAMSDACAAASLANSTVFASALNVKMNAKSLDPHKAAEYLAQVAEIEAQAQVLMTRLQHTIQERGGIDANS